MNAAGDLRVLPVGVIDPDPKQPRQHFCQRALKELAENILMHGQLEPIGVKPVGERFLLAYGERRWRATKLAGLPTIKALVKDWTEEQRLDAAFIENLQREDISPMEEARALRSRMDATGSDALAIAKRYSVKPHYVHERLALLNLVPEMQEALERKIIFFTQAVHMARLAPASQKVLFDAIGRGRCRSTEELLRTVGSLLDREKQVDLFADARATTAEQELVTQLELRVKRLAQEIQLFEAEVKPDQLRRVNPNRADVLGRELELMEKVLKRVRLAVLAAGV